MTEFQRPDISEPMKISLVIPVRNEASTLREVFDSVARQSRQPDELILVDGGSVDNTVEIARTLGAAFPSFQIIVAGDATPGRGRNIGIAAAKHEWIALTDAGIRLQPDWLAGLVHAAETGDAPDLVYGNFEPLCSSFFERCAALSYVEPRQLRDSQRMRGPCIASVMMRRSVWQAVGGFPDWRAAEDRYFMDRVRRLGFKVTWAADATVLWHLQPTLAATFRRFALYSCHNVWAGRQWDWHYGVAKIYLASAPFIILAAFLSRWWLAFPVAVGLARTLKSVWMRSEPPRLRQVIKPIQFLMVAVILLTIDLAMFAGWVAALIRRPARKVEPETSPDPLKS